VQKNQYWMLQSVLFHVAALPTMCAVDGGSGNQS
jgi:hypothetical protein